MDTSLPLSLGTGGYAFNTLQDLLWAIALATLAAAASRPAAAEVERPGIGSIVPVAAGLCALFLLVAGNGSGPAWVRHAAASKPSDCPSPMT